MKLLDRRRKNYIKKEEKEWLRKCLILNEWIPKNIRLFYFLETPWNAKITEIRNYCLIQKKKRSVSRTLSLSRYAYKRLIQKGNLPGEKRSQW